MLIARFDGDVDELRVAYDRAHALIMSRGGATGVGNCATTARSATGPCTSSACGSRRSVFGRAGRARSSKTY
jgi:hypothetical protein